MAAQDLPPNQDKPSVTESGDDFSDVPAGVKPPLTVKDLYGSSSGSSSISPEPSSLPEPEPDFSSPPSLEIPSEPASLSQPAPVEEAAEPVAYSDLPGKLTAFPQEPEEKSESVDQESIEVEEKTLEEEEKPIVVEKIKPEEEVVAVVPGEEASESPPLTPPPPEPAKPDEDFSFNPEKSAGPKNIFKILLIFLIILAVGAGVYFLWSTLKKRGPGLGGEVTLTYWGLWEDEKILAGVLADWEKENPNIKINYVRQAKEEYRERLQSALARGEGPDIFRFHNTWLPMFKDELAAMPASVMSVSQFEETFFPVASVDLRVGSAIYGLPLEIDTLALFYNEDLFRAAGKVPPKNWDELRRLASEMTVRDADGRIQIAGVAMGGTGNIDHWSDILGLMMLQNGVDLTKAKGRLAEDALTFYSYFLSRDRVWDTNFPGSTLAFAGGKVAMYFGFSWDAFEIIRNNQDLRFSVVPVPQLPERKPVTWASYWAEGVAKRSAIQAEAWEFLHYLSSQAVMKKLYQAQSQTRLFGEPYSRRDLAAELENDPWAGPFVKQALFAKSGYLCSRTFDNGINQGVIYYFENAINAINQGEEVSQVLQTASQGVSQILSRYQVSQ